MWAFITDVMVCWVAGLDLVRAVYPCVAAWLHCIGFSLVMCDHPLKGNTYRPGLVIDDM